MLSTGTDNDTIVRLMQMLESSPDNCSEIIPKVKSLFLPNLQATYALYNDLGSFGKKDGTVALAKFYLMGRSLNDLISGFHLATQGYIVQSYTVLRPLLESIDLIKLFSICPEYADLWTEGGESAWNKLKPSEVRKKLGEESTSEVYGHFCENGTHPTFGGGANMSALKVGESKPELTIWIGGIHNAYAEPRLLFLFSFIFVMQGVLMAEVVKLKIDKTPGDYSKFAIENTRNFSAFNAYLCEKLDMENSAPSKAISKIFDDLESVFE